MKKVLLLSMMMGFGLTAVQCTKTIEERIEIRERVNAILSGAGAPAAELGGVGDYYIDLKNTNLYGAKTAEGWGNPISLRGLQGEAGAKGQDGQNGKDAAMPNIRNGYWYIGDTNTNIKAEGKDGGNGKDGDNGKDGVAPHIGTNGNWFVGIKDTGVKAEGKDGGNGKDGVAPHIGTNGNWFVGTKDTGVKAEGKDGGNGKDGVAPHIGTNGNWFVGTKDTGVKAQGKQGDKGEKGATGDKGEKGEKGATGEKGTTGDKGEKGDSPYIGGDGYWYVGTKSLGVKAQGAQGVQGEKGATGEKGEKGEKGDTPYIGKDGFWYVGTKSLGVKAQGAQGVQGEKGATGEKGEKGEDAPKPNIKNGVWYIGDTNTGINAKGDKGDDGAPGAKGEPGKNGSVILAGNATPTTTDGVEGDYYIDKTAKMFYGPKTAAGWDLTTGVSLMASTSEKDYELSTDGKTLKKWNNAKTRFIDMNADPKLKEVETIAALAFNGEEKPYELRTFVIGNKVKNIEARAFNSCFKLTTVEADENKTTQITEIKGQTFANCTHLQSIDIPINVTTIGKRAFVGCYKLTTVILPEKVNKIESQAFMGCKNLHTVIIHNPTAFAMGTMAFNQAGNLRNIYVPKGTEAAYKTANPTYQDLIK